MPLKITNFAKRSGEEEIMDDLQGAGPDWIQALRELRVINQYLGGNQLTIEGINKLLAAINLEAGGKDKTLSIADIGCGGGDMLLVIARWARKHGLKVRLIGVDANPNIIEYAKRNTQDFPEIEFLSANIFSEDFKQKQFDIVTCTLFTHHFTDEALIAMLGQLKAQASLGLVVNDLHRHWMAYYSIKWITSLASKSRMVQHDAPISVLRSFSRQDWLNILSRSGLDVYDIKWRWAFRWMLVVYCHQPSSGKSTSSSLITG